MANPQNFAINGYGRFVSGDLLEKKKTDHLNKPIADPEKHKFNFGIAFRKDDPVLQNFFNEVHAYLSTAWATDQIKLQALAYYFAVNPQTGYYNMTGLSMKISDGDLPNAKGEINKNTIGHVVLWCATKYPPKITDTAYQEIPTESMKRGYYCAIVGTIDDNGLAYSADGKGAGIYLNIKGLILNAEGDVIEGAGMDVEKAMSNAAPLGAMPTGARALGSGSGAPIGMPGTVQGQMPGVGQQQAVQGIQQTQMPMGNVGVQGQAPMDGVGTQGMPMPNGTGQTAMPMTASPSNQMPNAHPGILGVGQQGQVQQPAPQMGMPQMGAPANIGQ